MRLWTLHPKYLDHRGLVALWREGLLARKVLEGGTRGYRHHPQLARFRAHPAPETAIAAYLRGILREAERRNYRFDAARAGAAPEGITLEATTGQLEFEWSHLMQKLRARSPAVAQAHAAVDSPEAHPLFHIVPGPVAPWERTG
ncbi:MAG TPA: pyrimidine dimer DNA glycosylase/endonuclease V [Longimicrobiales bacterium]